MEAIMLNLKKEMMRRKNENALTIGYDANKH